MPHFIGNILQDSRAAAAHPEAGDRSFNYSRAEKEDLLRQLPNLPIRFEHSEKLGDVGKVRSAFHGHDGRVWVVGEISDDGIAGKFVSKTIASQQHVGLSLGHEHTEYSDGSTRKRGLEVSICKEPRRPGCGVAVAVNASSRHYKRDAPDGATSTMTDTAENTANATTTPAPDATTEKPDPVAETQIDKVPELPSQEKLAEQVMQFAEQARAAEAQVAKLEAERNERIEAEKKAAEQENAARKTNAENLAKSVLEHVARFQNPNGDTASPQSCADQERAIKSLMESHPKEVETVLQVAHLCSSRAAKLEAELEQEKLRAEQRQLRSQYHAAVHQATGVGSSHAANTELDGGAVAVDVRASKRQRTAAPTSSLLPQGSVGQRSRYENLGIDCNNVTSAYQQFATMSGGSGSSVSRMDEIANIMKRQQNRGFR